jgi:hypothetical protein
MDTLQENLQNKAEETFLKRFAIKVFGIIVLVILASIVLGIIFTLGLSSSHPG